MWLPSQFLPIDLVVSLSILEAATCGVPTVWFNFGESVYEEVYNDKTGFIIEDKNDFKEYENKLNELMNNVEKLMARG